MESNYAKEVSRLREMSKDNVERIKVSKTADNTFKLARSVVGWEMGHREKNGVRELKVFTGTRYWYIPETQCEYLK